MNTNFDIQKLHDFITLLNDVFGKEHGNLVYAVETLKVRFRVTMKQYKQTSVYCFIDVDGNILFPAGWSSPTKCSPIRGSILSKNPLQGHKWSSVKYLTH